MRYYTAVFCALFIVTKTQSQSKFNQNTTEIYRSIQELNFLGKVLYIAAHPDDENTKLISYFSNKLHAQTYYLSLTRGDGGQNLLGADLKEALGIIRTQELLRARQIDGGKQRFTRAVDFGYSKSPEETLRVWNKDSVLSDVVWAIRNIKPDVIINRFDHRTPGTTHGHHTASAMLSVEAFDLANNNKYYPSQLQHTEIWETKRLFFNTSWWFYGSKKAFSKADKSNLITIDIGEYYPDLGVSNSEIAARSRSQHKSQAFGNTPSLGKQNEYLELIKGDRPIDNNIFEGIDTSWKRVKGGHTIEKIIQEVLKQFDFDKPYLSVPKLLKAYTLINKLENNHWKEIKKQQISDVIASCLGLYIESKTELSHAYPSEIIKIQSEIVNRSPLAIELTNVKDYLGNNLLSKNTTLKYNEPFYGSYNIKIPNINTLPYWLLNMPKKGIYTVEENKYIGLPETPQPITFKYTFLIDEIEIDFNTTLVYKYNDPINGETKENFNILPKVSILPKNEVHIFNNGVNDQVSIQVRSLTESFDGKLHIDLPSDWQYTPQTIDVKFNAKNQLKTYTFTITPPHKTQKVKASFRIESNDNIYTNEIKTLAYKHIPKQIFVKPAITSLVNINTHITSQKIGYIKGAGDKIPESLVSLGLEVNTVDISSMYSASELKSYDAIILGVRAYNTNEELVQNNHLLLDYIKQGGTLIAQYNTTYGLLTEDFAPFLLKISRERVTDENAKVIFLNNSHPVLHYPNKITQEDFVGWVQERGLYFPDQWSKDFTPIFEIKDFSDQSTKGSLLIAKYGEGYYIYTGLSLFRQLPEGVPGAYRLISNLLSIGKDE